jgi:hypothetical protein
MARQSCLTARLAVYTIPFGEGKQSAQAPFTFATISAAMFGGTGA